MLTWPNLGQKLLGWLTSYEDLAERRNLSCGLLFSVKDLLQNLKLVIDIDVDLLFWAIMKVNAKTRKLKVKYPNPYFMNT